MEREYPERNDASRERLGALLNRLSAADLDRELEEGWTVRAVLAHLAFWDRYAQELLARWEHEGFHQVPSLADLINPAALPAWLALPGAFVVRDVITAATATDAGVAAITPGLATMVATGGHANIVERNIHRNEHIDQIEGALGS